MPSLFVQLLNILIVNATLPKILMYDSQGFWLSIKRLSHGKFNWWPSARQLATRLSVPQLHSLLWNTQLSPQMAQEWQPINEDE